MSHLTPIKTQTANLGSLIRALEKMGLQPQQGNLRLFNDYWEGMGYQSGAVGVQVLVQRHQIHANCNADIGWRWTGSTYELVADEMELEQWIYNPKSNGYLGFVHQLHEEYAISQIESQLGHLAIVSREVLPNGTTRFILQGEEEEETQDAALMVRG